MGNTMLASDLHRILTDVRPFASKDARLPAIRQVRIESNGASIIAVATDSYVLGVSRADYSGEIILANITTANIDNLIRFSKTTRSNQSRTVEIVPSTTDSSIRFIFSTGEELSVVVETTDFPKFRQLLPLSFDATGQQQAATGYNATQLAKFAKVSGSSSMALISQGPGKSTVVTIGTEFIGVIMPRRLEDYGYVRPAWLDM